jgi:hypothetical protein
MFSLYKINEENINLNYTQDSISDEETYEDEDEDISIEDELLKLCKLRICLCRRTDDGELKRESNFIDTELIEESKFILIYN